MKPRLEWACHLPLGEEVARMTENGVRQAAEPRLTWLLGTQRTNSHPHQRFRGATPHSIFRRWHSWTPDFKRGIARERAAGLF
jgi:hypothetical protein